VGGEFKVDPASLRAAAGQLDEHAGEVASHGETLGANTAGTVGRGAIGEVVESAVKRGIRIAAHDISAAVKRFYTDAGTVMRKVAEETEHRDSQARSSFDGLAHDHGSYRDRRGGAGVTSVRGSSAGHVATEATDFMDTALPSGSEVVHGTTYTRIGGDDISVRVAENAPPKEGFHDVVAHGDGSDFQVDGLPTHPAQIAEAVRTNPNYTGQPIRLLSCHAGQGPAKELANALGVEVTAPTSRVGIPRTPPFEVRLEKWGESKTFEPERETP
jgi:hypothetical protein